MGNDETKKLILAHDKTLARASVLIDDKPEIIGAQIPEWAHLMFDQDYNRHIDTPFRMTDPSTWRVLLASLPGFAGLTEAA